MLLQLYIENIAVIQQAQIDFTEGFNVMTGETGAGKSIVIDAICAILGERTSRELIRTGADSARVSALFSGINARTLHKLQQLGYEADENGELLVERVVRRDGKSLCRIGGRPAAVSALKELGPGLICIHGQHDSYELLMPEVHIRYIDSFGGLLPLLARYRSAYAALRETGAKLDELNMDETYKTRHMDLLRYQIEELEGAQIVPGQRDDLKQRCQRMRNSEKIAKLLQASALVLDGDENTDGMQEQLVQLSGNVQAAAAYLPALEPYLGQLEAMRYQLEDLGDTLRSAGDSLTFDQSELDNMEDRLDELYKLGLKYGETEEEMLAFLEKSQQELQTIAFADEKRAELEKQFEAQKKDTIALAKELSSGRKAAAERFAAAVEKELQFLNMPGVRLTVEQQRCPLSTAGCDRMQFLISANPGEDPKPMAKIASGGELSRIMLSIKSVLAGSDEIDTLIFDEVDTGISGAAAKKVGLKLKQTAQTHQVLCVTHLPQIAAMGQNHLHIEKHLLDDRTSTSVTALDKEGRVCELARMISGDEITPLRLKMAREMLEQQ